MTSATFNETRVIFDLQSTVEADYTDQVLLCMPKVVWQIARSLIRGYGLRPINYAVAYGMAGYEMPDEATFDKLDDAISQFLGEDDMCTNLSDGLADIVSAIDALTATQASCCEGGSFGAGPTGGPLDTFLDDGSTTYPAGFNNRAEYEVAKCIAANAIIGSFRADMLWVQAGNIASFVGTILVAALFTPIPFDDILALAGFLVAALLQGILFDAAQEIIDYIDANAEMLVCILYSSDTAQAAETQLEDTFTANLGVVADGLVQYWINADSLNSLFQKSNQVQSSGTTMNIDCDDCVGEPCGAGFIEGQYNHQGFGQDGKITININADQFNVPGCGNRYREYITINPPSLVQVLGSTLTGNSGNCEVWRSSPVYNDTNWTITGLAPVDSAAHLIGTISLHTADAAFVTLQCEE